jgi:AraC family chitin signaling transcriptional activator
LKTKFTILLFYIFVSAFAQDLPPIIKYSPNLYGGGNQNWMISQSSNQYVFFANNEGLLEFNGSNWQLYPSPNETIIRSVKAINERIYSGCYMEFGFWIRQTNGRLYYTSLSKSIKNKILNDEQFWNILNYDQWVIFQSLDRIFVYDINNGSIKIVTPKSSITKSYATNSSIFFQTVNDGLFELERGKARLISNNPILIKNRIINVFEISDGLLVQTQLNGFYKVVGNTVSKFVTDADSQLETSSVYSSLILSDGSYAIGTVSNGVFLLSKEGKLKYHISQSKGLSNNTALSLYEDVDGNLWIGLDNGINCINLQSPIQSYTDDTGVLGTVYTSILFNGKLYIGTNQGLFYKNYNSNEGFKFISGTKGQVWSLFQYQGTLFCGHDSGTFIVDNASARNIFAKSGTWKFESVPQHENLLIQGNYYGLSVLEKINNQWVFRNKIKGFDYSSRYFEVTNSLEMYVSHEYKGVFRFQLDKNILQTNQFSTYSSPVKGKNASLIKYNNAIYYAYKEGIFKLNPKTKQFEKDNVLSAVFEKDEYTSGKLIVDNSNKIWLFSKNYIHYFSMSKMSNQLKKNTIPIPASLTNSMLGFENITQISNSLYLIGTTDGFYMMDLNKMSFKSYAVSLTSVAVNKQNEASIFGNLIDDGAFDYQANNFAFSYTVPEYNKYINAEYQYSLKGFQEDWSQWSTKTSVSFKNLSPGEYTFKVRAKFGNGLLKNSAEYHFVVLKPWYSTNFAVFIYFVLFFVVGHFINKAYLNYYRKQREKLIEENNLLLEIQELENEQMLMKFRNEQLSNDVDSKNRELAVSTMSLNSKNELLAFIKEDLKKSNDSGSNIKSVISTINKNITEEDSWSVFKEAFDNADKDFLKRIKHLHNTLTPNDLRLCAYLRLNLSSKEIAPLFNISVRSVEIKRYRLRKKMNLSHDQGLVEYIMEV